LNVDIRQTKNRSLS